MGENGKNGKNEKKILALGFSNFYCIKNKLTFSFPIKSQTFLRKNFLFLVKVSQVINIRTIDFTY